MPMIKHLRKIAVLGFVLAAGATTVSAARLWNDTPPDPVRPDRSSDPADDQVRREMLSKIPDLPQNPAPFLKLDIPDPLKFPRPVGLREYPADIAPPAAAGTPPRPVLPVSAKP